MSTSRLFARIVPLILLLGSVAIFDTPPAAALTETTGTIVLHGTLAAPGLTATLPGTVPDPAQWQAWPQRGWELTANTYPNYSGTCATYRAPSIFHFELGQPSLCGFRVSGSMWGWCDLSKGAGGGWYNSSTRPESATITSFRWTGAGTTLAVTGELSADAPWGGQWRGTLAGTVTLLHGTGTPSLPCQEPNGLPYSIPVVVELEYVLS